MLKNSNIDFFTSLIKEGKFINAVSGLTIFIDEKKRMVVFQIYFWMTLRSLLRK